MKHFFIALFVASSAFGSTDEQITNAKKIIPNLVAISPNIYRGGNPLDKGQDGIAALAALGIKVIIDFQGNNIDDTLAGRFAKFREKGEKLEMIQKEKDAAAKQGISFVSLPFKSHAVVDAAAAANIQTALDLMRNASPQRPIFIHCQHGADRTGLVAALYRVLVQKWSVSAANDEWRALGHSFFSRLFTYELDEYFQRIANGI